jgi:hypothetical protein
MKRYTFSIVIEEGYNEFWEALDAEQISGCDDVLDEVNKALNEYGIEATVKLTHYEDKE